jgi:hypothetical protein
MATRIDELRLLRNATAGASCISTTSSACTTSIAEDGRAPSAPDRFQRRAPPAAVCSVVLAGDERASAAGTVTLIAVIAPHAVDSDAHLHGITRARIAHRHGRRCAQTMPITAWKLQLPLALREERPTHTSIA